MRFEKLEERSGAAKPVFIALLQSDSVLRPCLEDESGPDEFHTVCAKNTHNYVECKAIRVTPYSKPYTTRSSIPKSKHDALYQPEFVQLYVD